MAEPIHNNIVAEINDLKVDMAETRRDMVHLAETMQKLQNTLDAAMPRREVAEIEARFERRVTAMEAAMSARFAPIETKVDTLIATLQKGSGAMWIVNIIWGIAFVVFGVYMQLRGGK